MVVDIETKRKIIELYFTQHKNIRRVAGEVQKSSREVVAVVKEHKQGLRQSSQAGISAGNNVDQQKEKESIEPPINVKAYELFANGLNPVQVASELKLSGEDTTRYYTEYLRLKQLPNLGSLLERLRVPEKISTFIELTNLALAEHLRASQVLQLLKMANSPINGMCNIEQNIEKHRLLIAYLRKIKHKEQLEHAAIHDKIGSAYDMLKQLNLATKVKKESLLQFLIRK
ncbi:MAG TPA: hypothetical protein VKA09_05400 [Nitrososphaeraceae archaeon]|nr:hypothetical protein [Nitrososphaeraceae archaeon]